MRGTLLMASVATQQLQLIELLLSAGASVHETDAFGCTAISSASCPLDHQPIRHKLARGTAPTASRQVCFASVSAR
jgi:methionine synthase I (cobalamin-dependent)|tara:strand:- start:81 stop:308 length:228 start_codon:yes stop_codon:yes gene_type:complete